MTSAKIRALDAAVGLVGTDGLRALTHARVDDAAGLPRGSTSNHFRTRSALLTGVVDWIVEKEMADLRAPAPPRTAAELVEYLASGIEFLTGPQRVMTTARLVLFMEASHNPRLREALGRGRIAMEVFARSVLAGIDAQDPPAAATALMACCEGLILHRIAREDKTDPRPALNLVMQAALR